MKTSLSTRVFLVYAGIALLYTGVVYKLLENFSTVYLQSNEIHERLDSLGEELRSISSSLSFLQEELDKTGITKGTAHRFLKIRIKTRIQKCAQILSNLKRSYPWSKDNVQRLDHYLARIENLWGSSTLASIFKKQLSGVNKKDITSDLDLLEALMKAVEGKGKADRDHQRIIRILYKNLVSGLNKVTNGLGTLSKSLYTEITEGVNKTWRYSVALSVIGMVASILMMFVTLLWLKPVRYLVAMVEALAEGNYKIIPREFGVREFDALAKALKRLAEALKDRDEEIQKHQKRVLMAERLAAVGKMASVMAHEIRNPLNSLALNFDMLTEQLHDIDLDENIKLRLENINKEIERLSAISEGYLQFGRMPQGAMVPIDVVEVWQDLIGFMGEELAEDKVDVELKIKGKFFIVHADPQRLRQAFMNLMRNAMEAMPKGGKIIVGVEQRGNEVVISVEDTGTGIPEEIMDELFEPFASTKPGGTGLGLAFVHQVVGESGGRIEANNSDKGGAVFRIWLPLYKEKEA